MKIFLLGATGSTGYEVLKRLVQDNHTVKVLVRNRAKLNLAEVQQSVKGKVVLIEGSILESDKLKEHFKDSDLVISALGTGTNNDYTEIYSQGGRNILSAMRANQIRKLITITSGLIDMSDPSTDNFFLNRIIRPNFNKVYYDQTRWETILDETKDIDWICVRPPYLTNKGFTGKYRVQHKHCPKGGRKISRADLADFIIKQMNSSEYIHKKPVIAY
ncbi:NAD(P)-dependent oxidoreductase [Maribellus maritimus]|uniref:NAD(P)-dependent oxidoreductase n=1 Tax=Maribellus maritimus TaxID=2870838 RepID=UPI001EEB9DEB|nr:SDR family oxidoreductase [Maribellus maritimus]MCG6191149.1 SDR family oxidoreductase [Maribellus maritimus]